MTQLAEPVLALMVSLLWKLLKFAACLIWLCLRPFPWKASLDSPAPAGMDPARERGFQYVQN